MDRALLPPRDGEEGHCPPKQISPQDRDLGSDPLTADFPPQTPGIEDLEVPSKFLVKAGLNQKGFLLWLRMRWEIQPWLQLSGLPSMLPLPL